MTDMTKGLGGVAGRAVGGLLGSVYIAICLLNILGRRANMCVYISVRGRVTNETRGSVSMSAHRGFSWLSSCVCSVLIVPAGGGRCAEVIAVVVCRFRDEAAVESESIPCFPPAVACAYSIGGGGATLF